MIISFSGAQSTGKTTLLNYLLTRNTDYVFVPEVTRLVRRNYNLPINEAGSDLTQLMIINSHLHNMLLKRESNVILDRCIYDGLIYTKWLYSKGKVSQSVYDYTKHIFDILKDRYAVIFYTSPTDVLIEDDGERSIDVEFRNDIIKLFEESLEGASNVVVLRGSVKERLETIKSTLTKLNLEIVI